MSYHVSILRTNGNQSVPIQLSEAKALLLNGPDWQFLPDQVAFVARGAEVDGETLWLQDGELWTKSPSEALLSRMIEVAKQLDARVRGDELETYESFDKWYTHPDDSAEKARVEAQSKSSRRQIVRKTWLMRAVLVLVPIFIGLTYRWITR